MVTTPSDERRARSLACCATRAWRRRYENEVVGFNTRMTDIHAAIGRVQLDEARRLDGEAPGERGVPQRATSRASSLRPTAPGAVHVFHQYTIRVVDQDRDAFADGARRSAASAAASTTRRRSTACRRSGSSLDLPGHRACATRRCSRCPSTRRSPQGELETIVEAVNAVAKAGA